MPRTTSIALLATLPLLGGCGPSLRSFTKVPQEGKRTVAFWSHAQANGGAAPFQHAIVEGWGSPEAAGYLCRLVTPDDDSVRKVLWEPDRPARYPGTRKAGSPHGRVAQRFAVAAGVDHVMMTEVSTEYETALLQPAEQYSLFGKLVLGKVDQPAVFGPVPRSVKFKLRYIDGHTGRVLWTMGRSANPRIGGYERVAKAIARKFHRRFPFRMPESSPTTPTTP